MTDTPTPELPGGADIAAPANSGAPRPRAVSPARQELEALLAEFSPWLAGHERRFGAACWSAMRADARRLAASVADMERLGLDLGERAPLALLPYDDRADLRRSGAFCHVLPGLTRDPRGWFADAGWTAAEDWAALARGLFLLVRRCDENPPELWQACHEFVALPGSRGFDSALVSPMLNALRPDDFLVVNAATRATLNHFTGSSFGPSLSEYPEAQAATRRLIENSRNVLLAHAPPGMRLCDCFAVFSHWLMNERLPVGEPECAEGAEPAAQADAAEPEASTPPAAPMASAALAAPAAPAAAPPDAGPAAARVETPPNPISAPTLTAAASAPALGEDHSPEGVIATACAPLDAPVTREAPADRAAPPTHVAPLVVDPWPTARADAASAATNERARATAAASDPAHAALEALCAEGRRRGQLLLCGRPGGGLTAWAEAVAARLRSGDGLSERLVFHPGWTREDFLQSVDGHGHRRAGRFAEICRRAAERKGHSVLLIHALHRADADAVFAEALELLDLRDLDCALAGGGNLTVPARLLLVVDCETGDGLPPDAPGFTQHFACVEVPALRAPAAADALRAS